MIGREGLVKHTKRKKKSFLTSVMGIQDIFLERSLYREPCRSIMVHFLRGKGR
jgi:hypothetical protein